MAKELTKKQTAEVVTDPNREQEIRRRAYALYEERGKEDGHDLDDWLRAETEHKAAAFRAAA
jgi:chorismate mutase